MGHGQHHDLACQTEIVLMYAVEDKYDGVGVDELHDLQSATELFGSGARNVISSIHHICICLQCHAFDREQGDMFDMLPCSGHPHSSIRAVVAGRGKAGSQTGSQAGSKGGERDGKSEGGR